MADTLEHYIQNVNRYSVLSRKKENELALLYRDHGDEEAGKQLITSNLRFVVKIAHQYRGYNLKLIDIIQEGNIGLMLAVQKFDPDRGYRLISYAVWWIRAYIQNYVMRTWSLVKLGTTQAQRKLFFKLRSTRDAIEKELESSAVDLDDLAKQLEVKKQDILDIQGRLNVRDLSLNRPVQEGVRQCHQDLLETDTADQSEQFQVKQLHQKLHDHIDDAMLHFNEKERFIVHQRLLSHEPQTLQNIGKNFGISRERARQIEGNVLNKLRKALKGSGLEPEKVHAKVKTRATEVS